jgi:hypothetical protein
MKIFIGLVDSNAQVPAYHKTMGLTKPQILGHIQHVTFYRRVVELTEQIRPLLRNKKGNEDKIEELRNELKDTYGRWKND